MAYTPPAVGAIGFTWVGAAPYVSPSPTAIPFLFDGYPAVSFDSTAFGVPAIRFALVGFSSAYLGTPGCTFPIGSITPGFLGLPRVSTFFAAACVSPPAQMPVPLAVYNQAGIASAISPTAIPTPAGAQSWSVGPYSPSTVFSAPQLLANMSQTTTGFDSTAFGLASSNRGVAPPPSTGFGVGAAPSTSFGAGAALEGQTATAAEFDYTAFGVGSGGYRLLQSAYSPVTAFGAGSARIGQTTASLRSTFLGTPLAGYLLAATGLQSTRISVPVVHFGSANAASSSNATVFGAPTSTQAYHVSALYTPPLFGVGAVARGQPC